MASVFANPYSLNTVYTEVSVAEINAANSIANAKLIYVFKAGLKFNFISNDLDTEVGLLLGHPAIDTDTDPNTRLLWLKIPGQRVMNYSITGVPWYEFDGGAKLYVYRTGSAASSGKFVLAMW